ncbi:hypothetical protein M9458_051878, partial [Cirrhinus mrigala]
MQLLVRAFSWDWTTRRSAVIFPLCDFPLIELINLILYLNRSDFEEQDIKEDLQSRHPVPSEVHCHCQVKHADCYKDKFAGSSQVKTSGCVKAKLASRSKIQPSGHFKATPTSRFHIKPASFSHVKPPHQSPQTLE